MKQREDDTRTNQPDLHPDNAFSTNVPVLIIGGGPTGLLLALLLSRLNIKSLVVEKYPNRLAAPKAHALSPRSLEICRQFGLDTAALRSFGTPRAEAKWVHFCTNLSQKRIGRLPYERMDRDVLEDTPEMIHNIPQPDFETYIAHQLQDEPLVEMKKGLAFISCTQDSLGVASILEDYETKCRVAVYSRYVVGCDGARSVVRKSLNIACDGEETTETMMTIHFRADIAKVVQDSVGMLHWCLDPAVSGFIISYNMRGDMVLISNFDPAKRPAGEWTLEDGRKAVLAAIGKDHPVEDGQSILVSCCKRHLPATIARLIDHRAGDAAHSFPPTGGLGLNCGLGDVHNLAWKLALAVNGQTGECLLNTYDAERRPVAEIYAQQSAENAISIFSFLKELGTANITDTEEARANLYSIIADESKQQLIAGLVAGQQEHFDNLQHHIGYVYGSQVQKMHASHYIRKFCPGARLPHVWIQNMIPNLDPVDLAYVSEFSISEREARKFSTLDLCNPNAFTIFVENPNRVSGLQTVANDLLGITQLDIRVRGQDYQFCSSSPVGWLECRDREFDILVRPDQHILALTKKAGDVKAMILHYIGYPERSD